MKNTRFMEVLFSAVEDKDEELAKQVARDIEDAKANGSVDTEEVKYENIGDGKVFLLYDFEEGFPFFLFGEFTLGCGEGRIPVDGFQLPVRFGLEIIYLCLAVYNQCQCRCLDAADRKYLPVLSVTDCI